MKKLFYKILLFLKSSYKTYNQRKKTQYLKDLFKNKIPIGKNEDQIIEILGNYSRIYSNGIWVYEVDMNRTGSKRLQFQIYFDEQQIVSYFIVRRKQKIQKRVLGLQENIKSKIRTIVSKNKINYKA